MTKRKDSPSDGGESTSVDGGLGTGNNAGSFASTPDATPPPPSSPLHTLMQGIGDASAPPTKKHKSAMTHAEREQTIAVAMRTILECLDDDPDREGLRKTPMRYAKALLQLTEGYRIAPSEVLGDASFNENHGEMVLVRAMDVFSHCEHHLLPFHGYCHVAYIPNGTVVGLSKIARIVDLYSRRLQVQERLTTQIADAVLEATSARGVYVYIACTHMCMVMRGVKKVGAETVTTAARGAYVEDPSLRREFLSMVTTSR